MGFVVKEAGSAPGAIFATTNIWLTWKEIGGLTR